MSKPTLVLWNTNASSNERFAELRSELSLRSDVTISITRSREDAVQQAAAAAQNGFTRVVAAGGDGTVQAVLDGLDGQFDQVELGILPLGTGNDLARTLALPPDPEQIIRFWDDYQVRAIDLFVAKTAERQLIGANAATAGNSGRVLERVDDEMKQSWGPWAYLTAGVATLSDLVVYNLDIQFDDAPAEHFKAWNVIVGNARTCGGGIVVSPKADVEDGLLDIIIVKAGDVLDIATVTAQYFFDSHLNSETIFFRQAKKVRVSVQPEMPFSVDSEGIFGQPIEFLVLPKRLRVMVGPGYQKTSS